MGFKDELLLGLAKSLIPIMLDLALDNIDLLRDWLNEEAQKTSNTLDDYLVGLTVDFIEDYLLELRDGE